LFQNQKIYGLGILWNKFHAFALDESYYLSAVAITKIMISDDDSGDIYQLNEYETEYSSESKSYKVTLNNTEVRYIHSIEVKYAVGKK